jgi:hypothetical protein
MKHFPFQSRNNEKIVDTCDYMKDNLREFLELHYDFKKKTANNKNQ